MILKCVFNDSEMLFNDFEMFFNDFFNDLSSSSKNFERGTRPLCRYALSQIVQTGA